MKHYMKLNAAPFEMVYKGEKTVELRLFDEKRRELNVGDEIVFTRADKPQFIMKTEVTALHTFKNFTELFAALPAEKCGGGTADDMLKYYSLEEQEKYGVVGIELAVTAKPYRDLYRFDPFLAELSELWQNYPDWRFGQLMQNFLRWLEYNNHGDGFYLEEEKYIKLLREFVESHK